jgi:hypothetical protein
MSLSTFVSPGARHASSGSVPDQALGPDPGIGSRSELGHRQRGLGPDQDSLVQFSSSDLSLSSVTSTSTAALIILREMSTVV